MPSNDNIVKAKIELEDGTEIGHFYELKIHQRVTEHHTFELRCSLSALESDSEPLINKTKDLFGKLIKVGFASGGDTEPAKYFFKGIITQLSVDKYQGIGGDLLIKGSSPTILLEEGRRYATFDGKTLSENVRQVMADIPSNLLDSTADPDKDSNTGYRVQYKESSFQYLQRLAKAYNQWLYFDGSKLYFGKKKDDESFDLTFGSDVTSMKFDYMMIPSHIQVLNYNPQSDQVLTADSDSATAAKLDDISDMLQNKSEDTFNKKMQLSVAFHPTQQSDMDGLATQVKNRLGSQYMLLKGSCKNSNIKIGSIIKVTGPNRSDPSQSDDYGRYRIIALDQTVSGGGSFTCDFEAISAAAPTPPYDNYMSYQPVEDEFATVKDNQDPDRMGRVKVQHIWQNDGEMTHWLDTSQVYAGDQYGFYFVPEIGDMVMVGFINGNPSYPYVKGSMYRKDHKPINVYEDDNSAKAIALSKNMLIQFDSDHTIKGSSTEIIGLASYDQDNPSQHPNFVVVTKDADYGVIIQSKDHEVYITGNTITINSDKEMNIVSGAALNITSNTGKLTIDAGANDLELKGMNVKISAGANLNLEGNAQTTVKGSAEVKIDGGAMVEVTGALIKLN